MTDYPVHFMPFGDLDEVGRMPGLASWLETRIELEAIADRPALAQVWAESIHEVRLQFFAEQRAMAIEVHADHPRHGRGIVARFDGELCGFRFDGEHWEYIGL